MKNENPYCEKASAFSIVLNSMRRAIGENKPKMSQGVRYEV
jgi:hypothetical protein